MFHRHDIQLLVTSSTCGHGCHQELFPAPSSHGQRRVSLSFDTLPFARAMVSPPLDAQEFWGYLVNSDKTPTPRFEDLLLGIAHYIVRASFSSHQETYAKIESRTNKSLPGTSELSLRPSLQHSTSSSAGIMIACSLRLHTLPFPSYIDHLAAFIRCSQTQTLIWHHPYPH